VSITSVVQAVSGDLAALFSGKDITTVEGLRAVIQEIIDAFTMFNKVVAATVRELQPTFEFFGQLLEKFVGMNDDVANSMGNLFSKAILMKDFGMAVGGALSLLTNDSDTFLGKIEQTAKEMGGTIGEVLGLIESDSEKAAKNFIAPWEDAVRIDLSEITGAKQLAEYLNQAADDGPKIFKSAMEMRDTDLAFGAALKDINEDLIDLGVNATDSMLSFAGLKTESQQLNKVMIGLHDNQFNMNMVLKDHSVQSNASADATKKLADAAAKARKELFDQGIAIGRVTAELIQAINQSSNAQLEWAKLDIEIAKLTATARDAGKEFPVVGDRFLTVGQRIAATAPSFQTVSNHLAGFSDKVLIIAGNLDGLKDAGIKAAGSVVEMGNAIEKSVVALQGAQNESSKTLVEWAKLDIKAAELSLEAQKSGVAFSGVQDHFLTFGKAVQPVGESFKDVQNHILGFVRAAAEVARGMTDIPKGSLDAVLALSEVGLKIQDARNKFLELQNAARNIDIGLSTARLVADTERIKALMGTVNAAISSSGDVLTKLFAQQAENQGRYDFGLSNSIQKEEQRRQAAFDSQQAYMEEQTRALKIRNEKAAKGENTVTVKAEGLQPHLEAIWFEIMSSIQVTASNEGSEMLLGVPA